MADRVLARLRGVTVSRNRAAQVSGVLVLLLVGVALPYVTMDHYNGRFELIRTTTRLFGADQLLSGIDPIYLPSYDVAVRGRMNVAFNVIGIAPGLQQVGTVMAAVTCCGLFFDEINKFLWWPLHLSSYLLIAGPLPLFIGLHLMRANRVTVGIGPGWVPAVLAGLLILMVTLRARSRIDSYGGV